MYLLTGLNLLIPVIFNQIKVNLSKLHFNMGLHLAISTKTLYKNYTPSYVFNFFFNTTFCHSIHSGKYSQSFPSESKRCMKWLQLCSMTRSVYLDARTRQAWAFIPLLRLIFTYFITFHFSKWKKCFHIFLKCLVKLTSRVTFYWAIKT